MPPITAVLHTSNDALRLGRALETLRVCREIIVVDHGSQDATVRIAREYGARILGATDGQPPSHHLQSALHEWILCLDPRESITEDLEATLYELGAAADPLEKGLAFSFHLREETRNGWGLHPSPLCRLIPKTWSRWHGQLPADDPDATVLQGDLLRFLHP
jgi:glycosyltransferase involved in cell wall biosynthesis